MQIKLDATAPAHVEELCTACFLPTMWTYDMVHLNDSGISTIGTATWCDNCD